MSTYITTFYDALYSSITTAFPTKTEITNPYNIESNDDQELVNGFGIAFNDSSRPNDFGTGLRSLDRDIELVLTRRLLSTKKDKVPRHVAEKQLLEDQKTAIEAVLTNNTIRNNIFNIDVNDDQGIEMIFNDKDNFLMLRTRFIAKFQYDILC